MYDKKFFVYCTIKKSVVGTFFKVQWSNVEIKYLCHPCAGRDRDYGILICTIWVPWSSSGVTKVLTYIHISYYFCSRCLWYLRPTSTCAGMTVVAKKDRNKKNAEEPRFIKQYNKIRTVLYNPIALLVLPYFETQSQLRRPQTAKQNQPTYRYPYPLQF